MSLLEDMEKDIEIWEGQGLEFMEDIPKNTSELAKEIAAFATSNPGTIYLGITDDGKKKGVNLNGKTIKKIKDELQNRIGGITQKTIKPPIQVTIDFIEDMNKLFVKINVPKGIKPVYYSNNIPYIRNLTNSEPATPDQVEELHKQYFQRESTTIREDMVFFETLMQLSDFELLWTDYTYRMVNPDFEQLRYDIASTGDALINLSFDKNIQRQNLNEELKKLGLMMKDLEKHRLHPDGGKSFEVFTEKGDKISKMIEKIIPRIKKRIILPQEILDEINENLCKGIQEINHHWETRNDYLERGQLDLLKEDLRRLAYNFNRISNVPAQNTEKIYSAKLKDIALRIRRLSSGKYFMKGIGINPITKIHDEMEELLIELNEIYKQLCS